MSYEYDIFISYKRHPESRQWLLEHFQPLLEYYVELELGRPPRVFRDDQHIEAGGTWPVHLGRALGNSRVLVALWTRTYFHSEWCTSELAAMLAREHAVRLRTPDHPGGLIVPVILHDCLELPAVLAPLQHVAIRECFNVRMRRESELSEMLTACIANQIAPGVAAAIKAAPAWQAEWPLDAAASFLDQVKRREPPHQLHPPRFSP